MLCLFQGLSFIDYIFQRCILIKEIVKNWEDSKDWVVLIFVVYFVRKLLEHWTIPLTTGSLYKEPSKGLQLLIIYLVHTAPIATPNKAVFAVRKLSLMFHITIVESTKFSIKYNHNKFEIS